MWEGELTFETPMLFAVGFIVLFTIGGFTGVVLAVAPIDVQLQDSYYVVAHFHYVLVAGSLFSLFAGAYFWLPKWTGRMYNERLGKAHFWLSMIFFNMTFFVQHFLGLAGMPRRIPDYALQFADLNMISSLGAFGFGLSQLIFAYLVVDCVRNGKRVSEKRVWEGADSLEWNCRLRRRIILSPRRRRFVGKGIARSSSRVDSGNRDGQSFHLLGQFQHIPRREKCGDDSCNARMREWAEQNGVFVALDDFYNSVTYLAPSNADYPGADPRPSIPLDLTPRPVAK